MTRLAGLRRTFAVGTPARHGLVFALTVSICSVLLTDFRGVVLAPMHEGDIAERDVVAPYSVPFVDESATADRQRAAEADVAPVYTVDLTLEKRIETRISQAFDMARRRLDQAREANGGRLPPDAAAAVVTDFQAALQLSLDPAELAALQAGGWSSATEELTLELLGVGMRRYVVADRSVLPTPARAITVVAPLGDAGEETTLDDYAQIRTPEEARQAISLYVLERFPGGRNAAGIDAAAAIARAAIQPNFTADLEATELRRKAARDAVGQVAVEIKRGARVVRTGDTLTARQSLLVAQLQDADRHAGRGIRLFGWWVYAGAIIAVATNFARATVRKFSTRGEDLEAMAFALVLVLVLGRLVLSSGRFLDLPEAGVAASLGLLTPVAGGAMLVRILINSESALVWSLVAAALCAAQGDLSALSTAYYLVTALTAAAAVGQARERLSVLRAGMTGGLVGAAWVVLAAVLRAPVFNAAAFSYLRVGSDALVAVGAGALSAVLALGIAPAFELLGFVTDAKLLELSNLNHPLLRQLMLRAPGTYHHSVIVGSLSEAACETIGANALLARVACYFHDIGKGLKPQYFVENQRDTANRHDRLSPEQSAQVIINHVREGAALARQYKLPKPIQDNIYMHHGTGLIQYFYARAKEQADGATVDESIFRYPGPKPNTREAGIIMLADKVEAACRTIQSPTEERLRAMIQTIISSVMNDGQFEECPLTLRELYRIGDTFTSVLLGIYHHRVEYPSTAAISSGKGRYLPVPRQGTITLEIVNPLKSPEPPTNPTEDYEAVDPDPPRVFPTGDDS